jgi:hypothetical protein
MLLQNLLSTLIPDFTVCFEYVSALDSPHVEKLAGDETTQLSWNDNSLGATSPEEYTDEIESAVETQSRVSSFGDDAPTPAAWSLGGIAYVYYLSCVRSEMPERWCLVLSPVYSLVSGIPPVIALLKL